MSDVNPDSPQSFADSMIGKLGITPFWAGPTKPSVLVNQLHDPERPAVAVGGSSSGFSGAARAALRALDPFNAPGGVSANIAAATAPVGKSAAAALAAGSKSLVSAGAGITSGFRWFTFIVLAGLALYVFLLAAPFLPRPQAAAR